MSDMASVTAILSILLTLFIVLKERKLLAFIMRRIGPVLMGRNGAGQILTDLGKLLTKEDFLIPRPTTSTAPIFIALLFSCQLLFSQNFVWGPSMILFLGLESMILYHLILILFGNIFFSVVGLLSQSRYAIIATARSIVHVLSLDIFITIIYSLLVLSAQSPNFHDFVVAQNSYWFAFLFAPLAYAFILIFLLESKRAPFDHAETESEVVAGYSTEYSGTMLMTIYLAEYLHLLIASIHFILFFMGGWHPLEPLFFLPANFLPMHESFIWFNLIPSFMWSVN
jgi:NADH:ubiquinone oxidoreductase subunit H